jgi:hypothetical protein
MFLVVAEPQVQREDGIVQSAARPEGKEFATAVPRSDPPQDIDEPIGRKPPDRREVPGDRATEPVA